MTGPSAYVAPGEEAVFAVMVSGVDMDKLRYTWSVSRGNMISGQGGPVIRVATEHIKNGDTINAVVLIEGLPEKCPAVGDRTAATTVGYVCILPIVIDEYKKLTFSEEKIRLDNAALERQKYPDMALMFMISYAKNTDRSLLKKRLLNIERYLKEVRKIPRDKITFINAGETGHNTRIYLMPKDSSIQSDDRKENFDKR